MGTNTENHNGRIQIGKYTCVEALRRVATILQVCSHVVPYASSFHHALNVCFFASRQERGIQVEDRVLQISRVQFRVVLLSKSSFIFVFVILHAAGSLHRFPCSVRLVLRARLVWRISFAL